MLKFYKIMFFNSLILSTLIVLSSNSWLGMWIGLEINLLSMIPLMNQNNSIFTSEAMMKYFISQAMASMIFLFSIISISNFNNMNYPINFLSLILNSSLLMKMGAAPFHFWFPAVIEGLNWNNSLLLLTWQKIAPFTMLSYNLHISLFFLFIIIFSSMIGSIMGLNQISLRKILTFSSINHISWMISCLFYSYLLWITYFVIYSLISINIIFFFKKFNLFYMTQLILTFNINKNIKLFFLMNLLSLGGLPPFLGFLPKWLTILFLLKLNLWLISLILIMFSLITLYFYIRISLSSLIINHETPQPQINYSLTKSNNFMFFLNFFNINSLLFTSLIFLF